VYLKLQQNDANGWLTISKRAKKFMRLCGHRSSMEQSSQADGTDGWWWDLFRLLFLFLHFILFSQLNKWPEIRLWRNILIKVEHIKARCMAFWGRKMSGDYIWVAVRLKLTAFFPSAELPVEVAAEEDEDQRQNDQRADHSDPQIIDDHMHVGIPEDLAPPRGFARFLGPIPQVGQIQNHRLGELLGADAAIRRPAAGWSGIVGHRCVANPLEQGVEGVEGVDVSQIVGTGYLEGDLILLQVLGNCSGTHAAGRRGYVLRIELFGSCGGLHRWIIRGANHGDCL